MLPVLFVLEPLTNVPMHVFASILFRQSRFEKIWLKEWLRVLEQFQAIRSSTEVG